MNMKASGRSALILTAGLVALLATPVMAAPDDSSASASKSDSQTAAPTRIHRGARHASRHHQRGNRHKAEAVAKKDDSDKKPAQTETVAEKTKPASEMPPAVANANAQMLLAGAQANAAAAIPSGNDTPGATSGSTNANNPTVLAAADQLNDGDRTLQDNSSLAVPTTNPPPVTTAAPAPVPVASATTASSDGSAWDQTTLIGKIFIGFGALLTMASAARMLIA